MRRLFLLAFIIFPTVVWSQSDNQPASNDFKNLKFSGYLQTQFQHAQSPGISSFSGGDFDKNSQDRFMIRRGRLKVERDDKFSNLAFQLDFTQDGVQLMDAYIKLHHPDLISLELTAGLFNRPFGYSIAYSSGNRDFPERARVFQTIMPRERDIGVMLAYHPIGKFSFFTAELGLINGSGYNSRDYDSKKDIIGNVKFEFDSLASNKLKIGFGGSYYHGSVRNNTESYYTSNDDGFTKNTSPSYIGYHARREYYGADMQLEYDNPFGKTTLKAEYVTGQQPGVAVSEDFTGTEASKSFDEQPPTDLYLREFDGYYLWLTQQIMTSKFTAIAAYDVYDPNTKIKENQIGLNNNTTAADIKFSTLGYGLTYSASDRVKFTLYYEHVVNGDTLLPDYTTDLKDDVFTARLQYRW
ncbi:porin [Pedobacter sp.]|uniref:porin n=1 Tax=Pedobacter sp. TaxID=1411316 RepID=UPI003D7F20A1